MLASIDSYRDRILFVQSRLVRLGERFPADLPCFPFDLKVVSRSLVVGIGWLQRTVVSNNLLKLPDTVPCLIFFNVVNNVIVCNDFFIVVVDLASKFDQFWVLLQLLLGCSYAPQDLGTHSCTVFLWWH